MPKYESSNPATCDLYGEFETLSLDELKSRVASTHSAFQTWKTLSIEEKVRPLKNLAELLRNKKNKFGRIITLEMGKPIKQSIAEIEKCSVCCEFYAENAGNMLRTV